MSSQSEPVSDEHRPRAASTTVVGLLVDPGLPTTIAEDLYDELPSVLAQGVSDDIDWEVRVLTRALPLDEAGNVEVWQHSDAVMRENDWDVMVCLTELTRRLGDRFFMSDLNVGKNVALISLPALGPIRLRHHVRRTMVRVIRALVERDQTVHEQGVRPPRWKKQRPDEPARFSSQIVYQETESEHGTDSYLALTGLGSTVRLIAGMVRINQPWRLVPGLDRAIAAAVGTAAFGIFYSSIWSMAGALSTVRLILVSLTAMAAMVCWLMFHNSLWEIRRGSATRGSVAVYNAATVITVALGVGCVYGLLLLLTFLGALAVIPFSYMETVLRHDVSLADYGVLAWFVSSMGTFAGALGSSFETDDAIQRATYGRREHERHVTVRDDDASTTAP